MIRTIAAICVVGVLLAIGIVPRLRRNARVAEATKDSAAPRRVVVAAAKLTEGPTRITLPGTANAFRATGVYAKASGFVQKVHVDLGDHVKAGQLLVELEIPETDEELRRAHAQVEAAEANIGLYETNAARSERLNKEGIVSTLAAEQAREQANSARAAAKTTRADVQRLSAVQRYGRITAPFSGVISRRLVEPGQLVNVGGGPGALLVEVADTQRLRVFFDVPQTLAGDLRIGQEANVFLPNRPAQAVVAKVVRTSGALDPSLRTLRAEVDIDGGQGILAGAFVNVTLSVSRAAPALLVPASALAIQAEGPRVAVVVGNKVRWAPIQIGRDLGKEIEIATGVVPGDRLVLNPPDDLAEGEEIRATDRVEK